MSVTLGQRLKQLSALSGVTFGAMALAIGSGSTLAQALPSYSGLASGTVAEHLLVTPVTVDAPHGAGGEWVLPYHATHKLAHGEAGRDQRGAAAGIPATGANQQLTPAILFPAKPAVAKAIDGLAAGHSEKAAKAAAESAAGEAIAKAAMETAKERLESEQRAAMLARRQLAILMLLDEM